MKVISKINEKVMSWDLKKILNACTICLGVYVNIKAWFKHILAVINFTDNSIIASGWRVGLGCRFKANCPLVGLERIGGVPSMGGGLSKGS